ncbi:MAG: transposase, mutator type, partial [Mycobacterium sp.]|nr:transposase, mutator type [Mycobacterium sp.]
ELFTSTEVLGRMAMEKMLAGLSTRRYPVGLEPVGHAVAQTASATSKSAVSRKFVAMTETALVELLSRDLSGLDLVAMIDGVHFAESCCIVALGIDIEGNKHPLALVEGATENATVVTDLLVGLRGRGWTSPAPCWWAWTARRRCARRCSRCSTGRRSNAARSTRSGT